MELGNALSGLGKGALSGALGHESVAYGREWAGVVVRAALADLESASPSSIPMQSMGEPVSEHSSLSRRWNGLKISRSISDRGPPSLELGLGE